ncbi:FAD binding domain-containing protein [Roseobacter sp. EG26]|uniref:FAD binding domain-containing protein n=1 Tax=Roseobacter sp. EG26 TaxID=3412477 RepID=UPI003CE57698
MKPAPFDYHRPEDLQSALSLLGTHTDASIIAGGQSLVPMMNYRLAQPEHLIDINRLSELDYIREDGDQITIGALARHDAIHASELIAEHMPLISHAYEWIAHKAVRNRGTLCGNLCHADPASEMPAIIQVLEATLILARNGSSREVPAKEFFVGTYDTVCEEDEMLVELRIPKPTAGTGWGFEEVSMRKGDFAWAAVVCLLRVENGRLDDVRIAVSGAAETALRLPGLEVALAGQAPSSDIFENAATKAADALAPFGSATVSADYKRDLVRALLPRVLSAATARAS